MPSKFNQTIFVSLSICLCTSLAAADSNKKTTSTMPSSEQTALREVPRSNSGGSAASDKLTIGKDEETAARARFDASKATASEKNSKRKVYQSRSGGSGMASYTELESK